MSATRRRTVKEKERTVTMKGKTLTLVGEEIRVGRQAPEFAVLDGDLKEVHLSTYNGKTRIIASVPSLDTSVCDIETRKFNEAATTLGDNVVIMVISMDLPFAQKRWCAASGVDRVFTLSDHRDASFGRAYGLLIKELRLLARAVVVVDAKGFVRYREIVEEVTKEPNYEAALTAARTFGGR